ncbi:hypothetical protein P691DRAFT_803147 [Macrolepiota fuliginosa MF-IS2]|uniref:Uncharacterized protein n=1 Tax=Macrolepiota fuliginosa MF-IS2 TaxID=1400762 RepID=A0A9P5XLC9_9AGAR|nr:hypothetical protein P691DRAFT_803147 [Macrolepiota fuliginosa MF-IS2]
MSQPPANENVTKNNDRLFSIYEAHLETPNVKDYAGTVAKLAAWLGDSKAYYHAARPRIVKLLVTAQKTLRGIVGEPLDMDIPFTPARHLQHPLTASYVKLVQAIAPFRDLFVESHLKDAITHLLQPVEGISLPSTSTSSLASSISPQSPPPVPSSVSSVRGTPRSAQGAKLTGSSSAVAQSHSSGNAQMQDDKAQKVRVMPQERQVMVGRQKEVVTESSPHKTPLQHSVTTTIADPVKSTTIRKSPSPEIVFLGMSRNSAAERDVSASTIPSNLSPLNASETTQASKQPAKVKPKKKRRVDIAAFVQSDLQDFKEKQAQAHQPLELVSPIKKEPEVEQVPSGVSIEQVDGGVPPTAQTSIEQPIATQPPQIPSNPMISVQTPLVQAYALPTPQSPTFSKAPGHPAVQQQSSTTPTVTLKPSSNSQTSSVSSPTAPGQPGYKYAPTQMPQAFSQPQTHRDSICISVSPPPPSIPPSSLRVAPLLRSGSQVTDLAQVGPSNVQPAAQDQFQSPTSDLQARTQPLSHNLTNPPQGIHLSLSMSPVVGAPYPNDSSILLPQHITQTEEKELSRTQVPRPLMIPEDSKLGRLFKLYEEYSSAKAAGADDTSEDAIIFDGTMDKEAPNSAGLVDDIATLDLAAQDSERWFQVIAFAPGHARDACMEFSFDLTQPDMKPISKWLNRETLRVKELRTSICLSLGCYSSQELNKCLEKMDSVTDAHTTKTVASLASAWPQNGGLMINVSFGGSRKHLPLAPPLVVTRDGFFDISEFAAPGSNSIFIHQRQKDFTDYTFVLQAHNPTFKQLQEVVEHRKMEVEWNDWLVDITRPLENNVSSRALAPDMLV